MINKNLTWSEIKALHQLYEKGETQLKVWDTPYFTYLARLTGKGKEENQPSVPDSGVLLI